MKVTKDKFGLILFLIILFLSILYILKSGIPKQIAVNPSPSLSPSAPPSGFIAIRGVVLCLPHKNTEGPQTLECAYGLKDDEGNYYALRDSDPNYQNITDIEMNKEVLVEGEFNSATNDIYPTLGVITISKITPQ